ncbi:aminopeptidase N-like [Zophobas morio]|uniref:aminopeptidase N-like n=1 Tax=Zophobas morio TaxID=2755281 RepID=UPI0030830C43
MLRSVKLLTLLLVAFCNASPAHHHALSRLAASANKLSGEVLPTSYNLKIRVETDFATTNSYTGTEVITLNVKEISNQDSSFQLHAKELNLTTVTLTKGTNETSITFSQPDPETDLVTIVPATKLEAGDDYKLNIEFVGFLSETSMVGFYKSTYTDDFKQTKYILATQFEETHARKAFPCFDEPEMKAVFTFAITYPQGYHAWFNNAGSTPKTDTTDANLETLTFTKTPFMSSYLVAFMVGDINCKDGDAFNKITIQLCSKINAMDTSAKTALDVTPHILQTMSDFTNYTYKDMKKLTLASIPDFAPGAMENWGLVNFREEDLLWYEGESSNYYQQKVVTVLAHELSHQWFGDLVTLEWWNEMFLNEGFATYFEYHAADVEHPDWQLPKQFVIEQLHPALEADSYSSALPLSYDTSDADYSSRTNDVSYNKGGSILRMVHHFLTLDNFKLGIKDYINNHVLSTVTSEALWTALQTYVNKLPTAEQPPELLNITMENWTKKPGYPILTVSASGDDVIISQEQFILDGEGEGTTWYVPITYTTSGDISEFEKTATKAWLVPGENLTLTGVLTDASWIVLNNQKVGYYRVNYDDALLAKISSALTSNVDDIDELTRAQIIDDQFTLAKAGKKTYNEVFDFLSFLKKDTSYYSWSAAFNGFEYLLQRTANSDVRDALNSFIKSLMTELYTSVPMEEEHADDQIYTLKQVLAHTWACKVGDSSCISTARSKFLDYEDSADNKPSPNLRSIIYCTGLQQSDSVMDDFRFILNKYMETNMATERITILKAMGCVSDTTTRQMYLNMILVEKEVKRQDARYVFQSVYSNGAEGVTDVLNFVIDTHEQLKEHFGDTSTASSLLVTLGSFITTQTQIDKLTTFSGTEGLDDDIRNAVTSAITIAEQNLNVTKTLENTFRTYFKISSAAISIGSNYLVNVVCVLVGYSLYNFY